MTGWNDAYPYSVKLTTVTSKKPAGINSWDNLLKWLDQTLPNEWEYFNSEFRFKTERAKMLFLLKWASD